MNNNVDHGNLKPLNDEAVCLKGVFHTSESADNEPECEDCHSGCADSDSDGVKPETAAYPDFKKVRELMENPTLNESLPESHTFIFETNTAEQGCHIYYEELAADDQFSGVMDFLIAIAVCAAAVIGFFFGGGAAGGTHTSNSMDIVVAAFVLAFIVIVIVVILKKKIQAESSLSHALPMTRVDLNYEAGRCDIKVNDRIGNLSLEEKIYVDLNVNIMSVYAADSKAHLNQNLFDMNKYNCSDRENYYKGFSLVFTANIAADYFYQIFSKLFVNSVISMPPSVPHPSDRAIRTAYTSSSGIQNDSAVKTKRQHYVFERGCLDPGPGMASDRSGIESIGKIQDPEGTADDASTCGFRRYFDMREIGLISSGILYHAVDYSGRSVIIIVMDVIRTQAESYQTCFKREIRTLEMLRCEGVPAVVETFEEITCKYLILASIDVLPLSKWLIPEAGVSFQKTVRLLLNLSEVLMRLSDAEIVHVDISPDTVLVDDGMNVRLVGFGRSVKSDSEVFLSEEDKTAYMAPEIWESKVTGAADIYSVGMVILSCLAGCSLSELNIDDDVCKKGLLSATPEWFENLILKMTVKEIGNRIKDPREIIDSIRSNVIYKEKDDD